MVVQARSAVGEIVEKPSEKIHPDDSDFHIKEEKDVSSPDILGQNAERPDEPEWHTKNLSRAPDEPSAPFAPVELDGMANGDTPDDGISPDGQPQPVDLTLDPAADSPELECPIDTGEPVEPPISKQPPRTIGLIDGPRAAAAPTPVPGTARAKDTPLYMTAPPPETTEVPSEETEPTGVFEPSGLAYSDGKTLRLPNGARFTAGETIEVNDYRYQIKIQKKRPPIFYVKAIGFILLLFLSFHGAVSFFAGKPTGTIAGAVIDSVTGKVLPGAKITLPDGTTTFANSAGIYVLPNLAPGEYEVRASQPGYQDNGIRTVVNPDRDTTLSFGLNPLFPATEQEKEEETTEKPTDSSPATEYGTLKLELDFENYLIYLDDRIYGKNVKKISKIRPGEHRITVEKTEYEDYHAKVNIKARRTTSLTVSLDKLKRKTTPRQRAKTRFAEGTSALDQGQYQEAIKKFDAALAELPEYPEARQYRGWAYRKLNNVERAVADLKAGAEIFALTNRYVEAIACVDYLIEMHPLHGEYHILRGNYHTALDELQSAIEDYEAAVDTDKKSLTFQLALAEAYYRDGQFKDAAKVFERARKLAADPTEVYVRLILSYMYAGKDKDLIKRYREFAAIASAERLERLQRDPEWKRVLQLIRPDELR